MSTIQNSDNFQVDSSGTQYKITASNLRTGTASYDNLMVERSNTLYKLEKERRYDVQYTDLLAVERSGTTYKVSGEDYFDYMWNYNISSAYKGTITNANYGISCAANYGLVVIGQSHYNTLTDGGRVLVYNLDGTFVRELKVPNFGGQFGKRVAIGGNRIVVSCPFYRPNSSTSQTGRIYVYTLTGTTPSVTITSTLGLGNSGLAVDDNMIAASESTASLVNGAQGSVHMYNLNGSSIGNIYSTGNSSSGNANYGECIRMGDGAMIVGQRETTSGGASGRGRAYIYSDTSSLSHNAAPSATFIGPDSNSNIGNQPQQVATRDGLVLIGTFTTPAYVYITDLSGSLIRTITSPVSSYTFGKSVAIGSGRIAISDDSWDTRKGRVYTYDYDGNLHSTHSGATNYEDFGQQVDIDPGLGCIVTSSRFAFSSVGAWWSIGNTQV